MNFLLVRYTRYIKELALVLSVQIKHAKHTNDDTLGLFATTVLFVNFLGSGFGWRLFVVHKYKLVNASCSHGRRKGTANKRKLAVSERTSLSCGTIRVFHLLVNHLPNKVNPIRIVPHVGTRKRVDNGRSKRSGRIDTATLKVIAQTTMSEPIIF